MKVILLQDVQGTGKKGEVKEVKDGYAHNFLIKKNLAAPANKENMAKLAEEQRKSDKHRAEELAAAKADAANLDGKTVKTVGKAGANGKLFGSVTAKDVAELIKSQYSVTVDKKKIVLPPEVKSFGGFEFEVKFPQSVSAKMTLLVNEE